MKTYVEKVRELENRFNGMSIEHIARTENQRADVLAKIGSSLIDMMGVGRGDHMFAIFDVTEDWRSAITQFLEGKGREAHEGRCAKHSGACSLAQKVVRAGFF